LARVIGLDVGRKRIGVAVSDELGILATPRGVILRRSYNKDAAEIQALVSAAEAEAIVVGLPLGLSGGATDQTRRTQRFAEMLASKIGVPVSMWDERFTTAEAQTIGPPERDDEIAAAIILQGFLDSRRPSIPPADLDDRSSTEEPSP